jgi:hypothetical protein
MTDDRTTVNGQRDHLGERQLAVLRRAGSSPAGQVIISSNDNADWCAAKRLIERGLLRRKVFGGQGFGKLTVYQLTDAGQEAVKRAKAGE